MQCTHARPDKGMPVIRLRKIMKAFKQACQGILPRHPCIHACMCVCSHTIPLCAAPCTDVLMFMTFVLSHVSADEEALRDAADGEDQPRSEPEDDLRGRVRQALVNAATRAQDEATRLHALEARAKGAGMRLLKGVLTRMLKGMLGVAVVAWRANWQEGPQPSDSTLELEALTEGRRIRKALEESKTREGLLGQDAASAMAAAHDTSPEEIAARESPYYNSADETGGPSPGTVSHEHEGRNRREDSFGSRASFQEDGEDPPYDMLAPQDHSRHLYSVAPLEPTPEHGTLSEEPGVSVVLPPGHYMEGLPAGPYALGLPYAQGLATAPFLVEAECPESMQGIMRELRHLERTRPQHAHQAMGQHMLQHPVLPGSGEQPGGQHWPQFEEVRPHRRSPEPAESELRLEPGPMLSPIPSPVPSPILSPMLSPMLSPKLSLILSPMPNYDRRWMLMGMA